MAQKCFQGPINAGIIVEHEQMPNNVASNRIKVSFLTFLTIIQSVL